MFSDFTILKDDAAPRARAVRDGLRTWHREHHDWARIYPVRH